MRLPDSPTHSIAMCHHPWASDWGNPDEVGIGRHHLHSLLGCCSMGQMARCRSAPDFVGDTPLGIAPASQAAAHQGWGHDRARDVDCVAAAVAHSLAAVAVRSYHFAQASRQCQTPSGLCQSQGATPECCPCPGQDQRAWDKNHWHVGQVRRGHVVGLYN